jgi:hypothetical protein
LLPLFIVVLDKDLFFAKIIGGILRITILFILFLTLFISYYPFGVFMTIGKTVIGELAYPIRLLAIITYQECKYKNTFPNAN